MDHDLTPPGLPPPAALRVNPARPRPPRLPGTDAASFARDMNWRHGVAVLWVFFVLIASGEGMLAAFILLQGSPYPAPLDALRLCLGGALFLALWLGWGWLRWPLATMNFFYGAWLIVWFISLHAAAAARAAAAGAEAPGYGIASIPQLGLALVYLVFACYLAFSADLLDFLRHRREEGRGWVFAPVAVLVGVCLLCLLNAQSFFLRWMEHEKASAVDFVTTSLRTVAADHWDAAVYESRADPAFLATWYEGDRKRVFAGLSPLGELWSTDHRSVTLVSTPDATGSGFVLRGEVKLGLAQFAHGSSPWSFEVSRTLFGPWKLGGFDAAPARVRP